MKPRTVGEIARQVGGTVTGDKDVEIFGISGIREARPGDITFIANKKYLPLLKTTEAAAVVVGKGVDAANGIPTINVDDPDMAFVSIVEMFSQPPLRYYKGIHPTAVIGEDVEIGQGASIQAFAVVQDGAKIGAGTLVHPGAYVGHYVTIGKNCIIYPRVVIRERITIGDNVIIHAGASIGSDGFGFATVKGVHHKIPQIGTVVIEDDVEIGANTCVDRARFGETRIRRGAKIDNLVQVAHNCNIGESTMIVSQVAIAGSTTIGAHCMVAGQVAFAGHVEVGDHVMLAGRAGVTKDIPSGGIYSGYPAIEHRKDLKLQSMYRKLPEVMENFKAMQKKVAEYEQIIEKLTRRLEELEAKPEHARDEL